MELVEGRVEPMSELEAHLAKCPAATESESFVKDDAAFICGVDAADEYVQLCQFGPAYELQHQQIANIRRDVQHKFTTELARTCGVIGIEDLVMAHLSRMARSRL